MIYQLSQVSNRDTQVLYFYRILRHAGTDLGAIYRYDNPEVYQLSQVVEATIDDKTWFEYHLSEEEKPNRIPYLEFMNENEEELKHIEDLVEVEVKSNELIIRGNTDKLTKNTSVSVYWVPSLQYIDKMQKQIESVIGELEERYENDKNLIDKINVSSGYVMNVDGLVPNLANIGEDDIGLIYDDSKYRLSGSVSQQLLVNPSQNVVSSMLKSHIGDLQIKDNSNDSKVYQGFYGGRIKLSGRFKTLVVKDVTSIVLLSDISADKVIIDNCPAVMFRSDIKIEGKSNTITRLEVRNSYLTIYQSIVIESIWCYRRSTVVLKKGKITEIGFIEAGSTFVYDTPTSKNFIDIIDAHSLQGLFYTLKPPENKPYLDDIFLSQKPISFQRGQVEDPVPISEAIVHIYLNQRGTPSPGGGTSDGRIYSPFTDWYWSGDSRTVGLIGVTGTAGEGFGGMGLSTLKDNSDKIKSEAKNYNLIFWWGVNGLEDGYSAVYKDIANSLGDQSTVFVGTVGRVMNTGGGTLGTEGGWGDTTVDDFNEKIKSWNENLKAELSGVSNIHVLDIWKFIEDLLDEKTELELAAGAGNGLHYSADLYQRIYDWVCSQITNVEPGSASTVTEDSDAAAVWNWFVNAGIAGVSDKPEVIAGIIGNFMCEAPNYGDYYGFMVLGNGGGYYGMWCESNSDFRTYMSNQGFSWYSYYDDEPSNSRDREAIPYELTWLTQYSSTWSGNFMDNIAAPNSQTGEAGARAYAELFAAGVEICPGTYGDYDIVRDSGVANCPFTSQGYYQGLVTRRDRAAEVYKKFTGG